MMKIKHNIKAVFADYDKFLRALESLAKRREVDVEIFSPMPSADVAALFPPKPSGVRWFAFIGGMMGLVLGCAFPVYTVLQWPIVTGGQPVVTMPTFTVVAVTLLIWFAAIFTLWGMFFYTKLPRRNLTDYDPRFSDHYYGFIITAEEDDIEEVKKIAQHAIEVVVYQIEVDESCFNLKG